jgi:type I restriction enzyme S subunit
MAEQMMQDKASEMAATQTVPKGYKQTEVGVIPEDWDVLPLASICREIGDGIHTTPTYSLSGDYFFINGNNIKNGNVVYDENVRRVDEAEYLKHSKTLTSKTIFLSINGTIGNLARYKAERLVLGKSVAYLTIKDSGSEIFSYYALQTEKTKKFFEDGLTGSTIKNLGLSTIRNTMIPVPSYEEQTAIANVLSDSDALIDSLEQLIAKKQAIKSATMQQLLTGRTRLPQFALRPDDTPKGYKSSELGQIPEDWKVCEMGALGFTYGGLTGKSKKDFGHGNGLYVPFTNVMANIIVDIAKLEKVNVAENQNSVINGDLLFNGSSETPEEVCFCSLVNHDVAGLYLNSFCFGFRRKDGAQYIPIYLSYWFRSSIGRKAVSIMAQGSTRYNFSKKQFLQLSITLPSIEEQTAIATILSDMDNELQALTQKLAKVRSLKQGMMQQLLTGRIRLPLEMQA